MYIRKEKKKKRKKKDTNGLLHTQEPEVRSDKCVKEKDFAAVSRAFRDSRLFPITKQCQNQKKKQTCKESVSRNNLVNRQIDDDSLLYVLREMLM